MTVVERSIDRTEVYIAEELFMTGTAAEVTAVTNIDHRPVGSGKMGAVTTQLRTLFGDVVRARNPKYKSWNVEV
jgi:branched-chain amino acid aminotransferase